MTRNELKHAYFEWMCQLVCDDRYSKRTSHHKLVTRLHEIDFEYTIAMDGNRAEDGTDLRYRFAYENGYDGPMIATYLDDRPCSVLEMMIALALRCEEHIMDDPDVGNRTGQWFWSMIVSLGLGSMTDEKYDQRYVDMVIDRFLRREYKPNGEGGLFKLEHCRYDLRSVEIWYQMNYYLEEIGN